MTRFRSATVLALLVIPAAASADERFAPEIGGVSPRIATEDGRFVFLGSQQERGQHELFEGFGEDAVPLGIRENDDNAIFDLHLATDARRKPVLVFSYCARSGSCDLFRYDFATRRRSRLAVSRRRCHVGGGRMERGRPLLRPAGLGAPLCERRLRPAPGP